MPGLKRVAQLATSFRKAVKRDGVGAVPGLVKKFLLITRLGNRIRVGGMAEISGYTNDLGLARRRTLEYSVTDLFPGGDATQGLFWSGLRPMTPDGTPIIGPTRLAGLFLNTGHGTLGWTMSSGSARLIADIVSGRKPEIDATDLALARYSSAKT